MNCFIESCTSTNDEIRQLGASGHPHGTWIAARTQTVGRGRLGRTWVSPPGNLCLSLRVRWPAAVTHWIPIVAGVWAANCLRSLGAAAEIKWPNDLLVGGKKLGGILCEGESKFVALGLGINCVSIPMEVRTRAISLSSLGLECTPEFLAERLIPDFPTYFPAEGLSPNNSLVHDFLELSCLKPGTPIEWGTQSGWVEGLGAMGQLVVKNKLGKRIDIFADEIR